MATPRGAAGLLALTARSNATLCATSFLAASSPIAKIRDKGEYLPSLVPEKPFWYNNPLQGKRLIQLNEIFSRIKMCGTRYGFVARSIFMPFWFLAVVALVAVAGCSDSSGQQAAGSRVVDASHPLVVITQPTEPPYAYRNSSGEIVGKDIDLARRIAAKMGRKLVVEGAEFTEILPRLKAGTADMGIATISITAARQKDVDFSIPYAMGGACFLYWKDGTKPRMSQITSLRVGVETDTVEDLYLCRHGCDPVRYLNLVDAIAALRNHKIDAVFSDVPHLKVAVEESGGRFEISPPVTRDRYGIAVNKQRPDVLAAANAVIEEGGAK